MTKLFNKGKGRGKGGVLSPRGDGGSARDNFDDPARADISFTELSPEELGAMVQSLVEAGDYQGALQACEDLEMQTGFLLLDPATVLLLQVQLTLYLILDDMENARYFWKRIPLQTHQEPSLAKLWQAGKALYKRDVRSAHAVLAGEWPQQLSHLVQVLVHSLRDRTLDLVCRAYSSIGLEQVAALTNLPAEQAAAACRAKGADVDAQSGLVCPGPQQQKQQQQEQLASLATPETLQRLTQYITFLEQQTGHEQVHF